MNKRTFPEWFEWAKSRSPKTDAWYLALVMRCGVECRTAEEIEARIARWEALEADAARDQVRFGNLTIVKAALHAAEKSERRQPRTGADILSRLDRAAVQALQPTINAELAKATFTCDCGGVHTVDSYCATCMDKSAAPAKCGCGGPAGHVPNGLLCRKGLR